MTVWGKLDGRKRAVVLGATLLMFAAIALLARGPGAGPMALLYAGLDDSAAGEVVAALDARGVPYEVRGDAIWVPESARDLERITLAAEGLPATSAGGYELLDSLSGFGTTSQMFDAAYWRAKEGELARTILNHADLKQTLYYFVTELFGADTKLRFRPSYFPFTEPSAEMDISCTVCGGSGCSLCKHTGWVEILGCGMVHPNMLRNFGIDPEVYTGFAFGMGVERITQIKYQVNDLRLYSQNDVRFLRQFQTL